MEPRNGNASYTKWSNRFIENDGTVKGIMQTKTDASGGRLYRNQAPCNSASQVLNL